MVKKETQQMLILSSAQTILLSSVCITPTHPTPPPFCVTQPFLQKGERKIRNTQRNERQSTTLKWWKAEIPFFLSTKEEFMFYSCLFPFFFSSSSFLEFLTLRISLCLSQSSPFCPFSPPPPLRLVEFNVLGITPLSCCFVVTEEFSQSRGRRKIGV